MKVRAAAVSGQFYPEDANKLRELLGQLLRPSIPAEAGRYRIIIAPHAGYIYSGAVAAAAYRALNTENVTRVAILGPCHRVPVAGMALPDADEFETPLGRIPVDAEAVDLLVRHGLAERNDLAHAFEHSIEVQIPFLQYVLSGFSIVPIVVGGAAVQVVSQALELLYNPQTLFVVSSDLSHFLPYHQACQVDRSTSDKIIHQDYALSGEEACGARAVNGVSAWAKQCGFHTELLGLANSGDTAGDKSRVVGYGAYGIG
ncbi:MAG: AmmeMemoRadiSam system protein B [Pseudomonadales bacterium]|nr:AmmeMemoRadiSam system protein B [Pseudomonadales bacterium]